MAAAAAVEAASRIFQTSLPQTISSFRQKPCSRTLSYKRSSSPFIIRCTVSTSSSDTSSAAAKGGMAGPIRWGCEIDSVENAAALQKWLTESGLPDQKMDIRKVDIGERGLVAVNNIRKGEKLLFVPPSLVISADSEWTFPEAGEVMKRYDVPDWPLIATYLISEASLMSSSRWSNYISALPRQPYSLLYWTRAELDRYLEASQIRERAIERINNVTGTYDDLRARIFSKHPNLFPEEVFNMETFRWSFGILFSRLVRLPSLDGRVALVPWADMLNHSCDVETFLDYDKSTKGVVFTTDRAYQPGEQVFISYGRKSNGELLLSYGFVPRQGTNPRDSVELPLAIKKSDKCYEQKVEALKKHGLSASQCFPLQVTGWPLELMAYAFLAVSPPSMSGKFEEMAAAASNKTNSNKELRYPELEEQAFQFILDSCESSISKYTKFLQASGSMDLDITSPKQLNRKVFLKQLAVDLCNSEQRILFRAQYILRRKLRDMRSGELKALNLFDSVTKFFK
uniref:ribulose-1,5 bisphosphate carboxylase/oxygenase large subunit N-methyltransferase, chloroplastic n=1 Tax=Erigeron canadensis TaxID=72917 RepID=UPI001CB993B6|nr:ribulose-1,5 bisphosphate carboxylase/oxygenase large subunit N-methyltransferase, chloroplastic [Erigeron canadensis]